MGKKVYKKVYKTNTKLLKRLLIVTIIILVVGIFAVPVKKGIELLYLNTWKWHEFEEYNFSVKLPRAYKDIAVPDEDLTGIVSSSFKAEAEIEVNEEYVSKKLDVVYNGGNILNGISLMIQGLATTKTTRTLDDIAESHHVLVSVYYEDDYYVGELNKEYVEVLGTHAIKASTDISNEDEGTKTIIAYLVPMEDKEITITFLGKKEMIEKSMDEIEKIVSQMK